MCSHWSFPCSWGGCWLCPEPGMPEWMTSVKSFRPAWGPSLRKPSRTSRLNQALQLCPQTSYETLYKSTNYLFLHQAVINEGPGMVGVLVYQVQNLVHGRCSKGCFLYRTGHSLIPWSCTHDWPPSKWLVTLWGWGTRQVGRGRGGV